MKNAVALAIVTAVMVASPAATKDFDQPAAQTTGSPSTSPVVSLGSLGHVVADLDVAVAFYRDVLDLDLAGPVSEWASGSAMQTVMNTPGARVRSARFTVPNEPFTIELMEFAGIDRTPRQSNHNDPGSSFINIGYLDVTRIFGPLRAANPVLISKRGIPPAGDPAPAAAGGPPRNVVWFRDPDGFIVEVMSGGHEADLKPRQGIRNAFRAHFGGTMEHIDQAVTFYRDLLGFDVSLGFGSPLTPAGQPNPGYLKPGTYRPAGNLANVVGVPAESNMAGSQGHCAGAWCEWFEFKDAPRTPFTPRMQDPGAAYLSVWVRDIGALSARLKTAGIDMVSTGGVPVTTPAGRQLLVRDPSGFLVLLMEKR